MNNTNEVEEIDLLELIGILLHHIIAIVVCTVIGGVVAGLITVYAITPQYQASATIYILNNETVVSLSDLQMGSSLASDYEEMITSRTVTNAVIKNLKLDMSYEEMLGHVAISNAENTRIIKITITHPNPVTAANIANEYAKVSKVKMSKIMAIEEPTDVDEAVVPKHQSSPNNAKNIVLGAMLGLLISCAFFIIRYMLDDTIKNSEDVERYLHLNTLAAVPEEGGTDNSEKHHKRFRGIRK